MSQSAWWKGKRGEWYVVVQAALFILIIFGPRTIRGWPEWSSFFIKSGSIIGFILIVTGIILIGSGFIKLGKNLTPIPYPKEKSVLVVSGPYRIVRHPIYSGGIFMAFGWALSVHGWLTIIYSFVLLIFLDIKSRLEEQFLTAKFPDYKSYQKKVHKLIPYIY